MAGSIPTDGLVAAWDLTGWATGTQTFPPAHGTIHDLTAGTTSGVEISDPFAWLSTGVQMTASGADWLTALSLAADNTPFVGDITLIWVGRVDYLDDPLIHKATIDNTKNIPFWFWPVSATHKLQLRRLNAASAEGKWDGPLPDNGNFQMLAVTSHDMGTAPVFWVNRVKTTGVRTGGVGTGPPSGNADPVRFGATRAGHSFQSGIVSYALIYSRIVTDEEMAGIWEWLNTFMTGKGVPLTGFGEHTMGHLGTNTISGQVTSASSDNANAWRVFEGSRTSNTWSWFPATKNAEWLQIDLGADKSKRLESYELCMNLQTTTQGPRDWTIQGSNDAVAWAVLATVVNAPVWTAGESRLFGVDTVSGPFRYFRYAPTANRHASAAHQLAEWYLYETAAAGDYRWGLPTMGFGS